MRSVVTGAAGFIGSHLAERLLALGHEVLGIDCLTSYYDPAVKRANLAPLLSSPKFQFVQADLVYATLPPLLEGADYIFHQAGQPGVRASWNGDFTHYVACNIVATQRLLEAAKQDPPRKLIYASSSSVYGNAHPPMCETMLPTPLSPYGVTKLAGEQLCLLYCAEQGVPTVALRYFTVYGPRQRPDMAIHRFIQALLRNEPIMLYGDGTQRRDFTYIDDIVQANLLAAFTSVSGVALNIGGGSSVSLSEALALLQEATGCSTQVTIGEALAGDSISTAADCQRAHLLLGYSPRVSLKEGLCRQVAWHTSLLS